MVDLIKKIYRIFIIILIPFIFIDGIFYIIGSFVAWDVNPYRWWIFSNLQGQSLFAVYQVIIFAFIPKFWKLIEF